MGWTRWNGPQIVRNVENASIRAVEKTGYVVLTASKQQVPLDEGFLLRSGIVIVKHENIPIAIICFGGGPGTGHPRIPYAVRWHETQANFQHGRKWKYLKDPFNQLASRTLIEALKQELRGIL
jgi:hypothetical protein